MRYIVHIINLIVQNGSKEVGKYVHHIKKVLMYIRQSPSRFKKFKECIEIEKKSNHELVEFGFTNQV